MNGVDRVTAALLRAWQTGERQSPLGLSLASAEEAYQVQQRVGATLGWFSPEHKNIWKLGFGSQGFSAARIPPRARFSSGWKIPDGYCHAQGIEAEIVLQLGDALGPSCDLADAYHAVAYWMPGIELCDTRWHTAHPSSDLLRLADQQLNRALIVGAAQPFTDRPVWQRLDVSVMNAKHRQISDQGSHPCGDPLAALPWLAHHAARYGLPLQAGDWIATGSWSGLFWAAKETEIEVAFANQYRVKLHT